MKQATRHSSWIERGTRRLVSAPVEKLAGAVPDGLRQFGEIEAILACRRTMEGVENANVQVHSICTRRPVNGWALGVEMARRQMPM